jgi:hypothetical protein
VDRKRFQFSLASLLVVMTACAVLLSAAKMFPLAAVAALKIAVLAAVPVACAAGVAIRYRVQRAFDFATLLSATLVALTLELWALAFFIYAVEQRLSLTHSFHVSVCGPHSGNITAGLVFFSDELTGPYQGSILYLTDDEGNPPYAITRRAWGEKWGIYYRHFLRHDTGQTLWTLSVSLAYPLAFFSILPAIWGGRRWRARRMSP